MKVYYLMAVFCAMAWTGSYGYNFYREMTKKPKSKIATLLSFVFVLSGIGFPTYGLFTYGDPAMFFQGNSLAILILSGILIGAFMIFTKRQHGKDMKIIRDMNETCEKLKEAEKE